MTDEGEERSKPAIVNDTAVVSNRGRNYSLEASHDIAREVDRIEFAVWHRIN